MKRIFSRFLLYLSVLLIVSVPSPADMLAFTPPQKSTSSKNTAKKRAATKTSTRKKSNASGGKGKAVSRPKTSAEARRQQEATQREIRLTEQQIKENDRSIKAGLNELGKLETDISASRKIIQTTTGQINALTGQINSLESGIAGNEKELKRLREEYLKAVKKMRVARKNHSDLAFIFASESFNQALRRMRYLKQFSQWKDRQSAAIDGKTKELKQQKTELADARSRHDATLRKQKAEEATLVQQHSRQDAIVADLKKNGDALKTHLSKKQAEANQLRNQIAALIAEEERKAAEERARKEKEERLAREREEQRIREAQEAEEARKAELLASNEDRAKETVKDNSGKDNAIAKSDLNKDKSVSSKETVKSDSKKEKVAKETKKKEQKEKKQKPQKVKEPKKESGKNYADARKRRPRSQSGGQTEGANAVASASRNTQTVGGNFGSMKGSLPKPASGAFKVTSRFGRQSLPDLPDVVYDNPGIDAEVSAGASALAVYAGKVSGVYMLPGYNTVVIVNHGNYYTVYGNIASPSVRIGDEVRAGQGLGSLATDEDDRSRSSIHFEVWRSREKLNPLDWIRN